MCVRVRTPVCVQHVRNHAKKHGKHGKDAPASDELPANGKDDKKKVGERVCACVRARRPIVRACLHVCACAFVRVCV